MTNESIMAFWRITCNSARSHAESMAAGCRREYAALIRNEAKRFCERQPPESDAELSQRQKQALYLTSKISAISHADLMARNHPSVATDILKATSEFVDGLGLDDSPFNASMQLTSVISLLGHTAMMQRA